jgi:methylase of polypeptide subunit release factors
MDDELSEEQQYMLRKVRLEAESMSRQELVEALCDSWEARYRQRQIFTSMGQQFGLSFTVREEYPWQRPETEEEFEEVLGFVPTENEAEAYLKELWENARMDIDMDEIVLTPDEESG